MSRTSAKEVCGNCRWYQAKEPVPGECRRSLPANWRSVNVEEWCYYFKEMPKATQDDGVGSYFKYEVESE